MSKRLPPFSEIVPVFALVAFLFYGWSLVVFLWKVSGWIFFLNIGEITVILAYQLTTNLFESIIFVALLVFVAAALPGRFLKDDFSVRGGIVSVVLIGAMMLFLHFAATVRAGPSSGWVWWAAASLALSVFLAWLSTRIRALDKAFSWMEDQLTVFLFLLLPLSLLSTVVVAARFFM